MRCLSLLLFLSFTGAVVNQEGVAQPVAPRPSDVSNATVGFLRLPSTDPATAPLTAPASAGEAAAFDAPPPSAPAAPPAKPEPWHMPQLCVLKHLGITTGGWVQQGLTYNNWMSRDGFNGPVATNDRANEYELNQAWLFFDRPTKTDGCGWDLGGHIDMSFGTDWRFGRNFGLENRINAANQFYGLVLPQFYLEAAYNDLTVKMGHYGANMGYENIPAPVNFFYSHSYALSYAEPVLVTGVQGEYKLDENWSVNAGFNRGWMMFEDLNHNLDFLGGLRYVGCDKKTTISFMTSLGAQDDLGLSERFVYTLMWQQKVSEKLLYVAQHDLGTEPFGNPRTGTGASWYGLLQYFIYTINPKWSAGMRYEWFRDAQGSRVAGVGNWIGSNYGWLGAPGFAGDFNELTFGLNWRPHTNFVIRPELRYDWYNGTTNLAGQMPFNSGNAVDQFLAAVDMVITF